MKKRHKDKKRSKIKKELRIIIVIVIIFLLALMSVSLNKKVASTTKGISGRGILNLIEDTLNYLFPNSYDQVPSGINQLPSIQNFKVTQGVGGLWTFTGQVHDEEPETCTVFLSGLSTVTINKIKRNGDFSHTISLPIGKSGEVTATAQDFQKQKSKSTSIYIFNS